MGATKSSPQGSSSIASPLAGLIHWMSDSINHVFGNPREEAAHQPPSVGVQPYRDRPAPRR
jgi:hypothetical protein